MKHSLPLTLLILSLGCADPPVVSVTADSVEQRTDTATDSASASVPDSESTADTVSDQGAETPCPAATAECGDISPLDGTEKSAYPIILVHGMGGFENLGPIEYYFGVPKLLRKAGYSVHVSVTDPWNSSENRAQQLAVFVDQVLACTCAEKVNLIGHSQGGIDIRYMISGMGYGDRVSSATTIAAPHHGTEVADALLGLVDGPAKDLLSMFVSIFTGIIYGQSELDPNLAAALHSCSTAGMKAFNEAHPDDPNVAYFSFAGLTGVLSKGDPECNDGELPKPKHGDIVAPELVPSYAFLGGSKIPNDGLVRVTSTKWGRFRGCIAADHLDEVGQLAGIVDSFDYNAFYLDHAAFLAGEGH
jgi:triacylglycerol esterase/lipase EstA (alpha/beta hydrolase family)